MPTPDEFATGVVRAVETLGTDALSDPRCDRLRDRIVDGATDDREEFVTGLTVTVLRILFLCLSEDRALLHPPSASAAARKRYEAGFSLKRLRYLASAPHAPGCLPLWGQLHQVFTALGQSNGRPDLALPHIGSGLWDSADHPDRGPGGTDPETGPVGFSDLGLLATVRHLAFVNREGSLLPIDFGRIGADELGCAYERLLALAPVVDPDRWSLALRPAPTNRRRSRGSFYTPPALVTHLLDTALEPTIDDRLRALPRGGTRERRSDARVRAVLSIRVCDPAAGSGRFLVAAAERLTRRLISTDRSGQASPHPHLHRQVLSRCIHGIDIDPLAVELCKVALWLEYAEPGLRLSTFDGQIKVGNALLGTDSEAVARGIPDVAFETTAKSRRANAATLRQRNRVECSDRLEAAQCSPQDDPGPPRSTDARVRAANAWCAAFFWHHPEADAAPREAITDRVLQRIAASGQADRELFDQIDLLTRRHRFFHWHLEYPEVLGTDGESSSRESEPWASGFDVILGNPPFLNQLQTATTSDRAEARLLRAITGDAVRGYTDTAAAFLLRSVGICRAAGRVGLLLPQSVLAAAHAAQVRRSVLQRATLTDIRVHGERAFGDASVLTCAVTLEVTAPQADALAPRGSQAESPLTMLADAHRLASGDSWSPLVASAFGVPTFEFASSGILGSIATATADFRDQYYGLDGFLVEDAELTDPATGRASRYPPVVTVGLLDLAQCHWGRRTTRIHKRRWSAPRVDRRRLAREGSLAGWLDARLVPKVLLATQTKVLEVFVDDRGMYLPSLPLITVIPKPSTDLWLVAAALASPVASAVAMQRHAGAAMSAQAIKLSAKQCLQLPLPSRRPEWDLAADLLRDAHADPPADRPARLREFGAAATAAYDLNNTETDALVRWWSERLPGQDRH